MTGIRIKIACSAVCFLLALTLSIAQESEKPVYVKRSKLKGFGKNAERIGDIYNAIDYYEAYCVLKPFDYKTALRLADLYRMARDYDKARELYYKVYSSNSKKRKYKIALYHHSILLKMNSEYDQAYKSFQRFKKEFIPKKKQQVYRKLLKSDMEGCIIAPHIIDSTLKIQITHLDSTVNNPHIDFSPLPLNDSTFIYASLQMKKVRQYDPSDSSNIPVRKFFIARKQAGKWKGNEPFEGPFNKPAINTGNGALSPDGNHFYFTRCTKNWQNEIICSIYRSHKSENGTWSSPVKLGKSINNQKYTATQPAVGKESKKNQDVLYFVSNRRGGRGGLDIWYSIYDPKTKQYATPKNAGSKINTAGDEITPFYNNHTKTLYFSSNGWPNIGGFDIFRTQGELKQWLPLKNAGYPINSSVDDLYFVTTKDGEKGYFASNRKGGYALKNETCCDDLYEYKYLDYIRIGVKGQIYAIQDTSVIKYLYDKFKFTNDFRSYKDSDAVSLFSNVVVSLYLIDKQTEEVILLKKDTTGQNGDYFFDLEQGNTYQLAVDNYKHFNKQINVSTEEIYESDTLEMDAILIDVIPRQHIILKNIYYQFDEDALTPEAKTTIDTTLLDILRELDQFIVEISSHTDSKGEDQYNMELSQRRAESVVKYLISKGIKKERLIAKGYGETQPIAPNEKSDGTDDPDGRALNRRTEFKIVGTLNKESRYFIPEDNIINDEKGEEKSYIKSNK